MVTTLIRGDDLRRIRQIRLQRFALTCIYLFINIHKVFGASIRIMVNKHTMNRWHSQLLFTYI